MKTLLFYIAVAFLFVMNKLPMCVLHFFSTLLYYPVYHIIRYRKKVVRDNLVKSFPEKDLKEIKGIEKKFYRNLCDYFVEMVKYYGMSESEIKRYMRFEGVEKFHAAVDAGHPCVLYMGHFFNWEYVTSITLHFKRDDAVVGDIYHPLENKRFDALVKKMRDQYGAESITMANTLRRVMQIGKSGKKYVIGFIADQHPQPNDQEHVLDFLNHPTAFLTGAEAIGRKLHCRAAFFDVRKVKRGHYECTLVPMSDDIAAEPRGSITTRYARLLEQRIQAEPSYWLWTHKRWKRPVTFPEGYNKDNEIEFYSK